MSSITGGQFNQTPFNAGGVNQFNNNLPPKEPLSKTPRKAPAAEETEIEIKEVKGDTFTPANVKPPEKPAFPVASTAIGGGIAGTLGFLGSFFGLPEQKITDLDPKKWGVTVDKEKKTINYDGYEYKLEEVASELKVIEVSTKRDYGTYLQRFKNNEKVFDGMIYQLSSKDGKPIVAFETLKLGEKPILIITKKDLYFKQLSTNKAKYRFEPQLDETGKMTFKESSGLKAALPNLQKEHLDAIDELKSLINTDAFFELHNEIKKMPNPEPIENLIQGGGRKWGVIAAITAGAIAVGAGIGYLLSHKNPQQQSSTKEAL